MRSTLEGYAETAEKNVPTHNKFFFRKLKFQTVKQQNWSIDVEYHNELPYL